MPRTSRENPPRPHSLTIIMVILPRTHLEILGKTLTRNPLRSSPSAIENYHQPRGNSGNKKPAEAGYEVGTGLRFLRLSVVKVTGNL